VQANGTAGVVIGLLVVALLLGGILFIYKKRQEEAAEGGAFLENAGGLDETNTVAQRKASTKARHDSVRKSLKQSFKKTNNMNTKGVFSAGQAAVNEPKNRFKDILPYDHNRVHMSEDPSLEGSDYINASFVPRYGSDLKYIVAQGPVEDSVSDFVRMIWEQGVETIAMLTEQEHSVPYFSETVGETVGYGDLAVTFVSEEFSTSNTVVRTLNIDSRGSQRTIKHLQYLAWPTTEAPEDPQPFMEFRELVLNASTGQKTPLLIHDASGVGQAAVFVCVDRELDRFADEGVVDIFECVSEVRKSRAYMVLEASHYTFIHQCVFYAIESQPLAPAPGLPADVAHFVQHLKVPAAYGGFDLGTNGRRFVRLGHFSLQERLDGHHVTSEVVLAVTTDVLIVCKELAQGGYEMSCAPLDRGAVSAADAQHAWDEPLVLVKCGNVKLILEASTDAEKRDWVQFLQERTLYKPTAALKGPRLIPLKPASRAAIVDMLGVLDPAAPGNDSELRSEYAVIPKVGLLSAEHMTSSAGQDGKRVVDTLAPPEAEFSAAQNALYQMPVPVSELAIPAYNSLQLNDMHMSPDSVPALAKPMAGYTQPLSLGSNYGRMGPNDASGEEGYLQISDTQGQQPAKGTFDEPSALQVKLMKRKESQQSLAMAADVAGNGGSFGIISARMPVVQNPVPTWQAGMMGDTAVAETSFGSAPLASVPSDMISPPKPPPRPSMVEDTSYNPNPNPKVQPGKWDRRLQSTPEIVTSRPGSKLTEHFNQPQGGAAGAVGGVSLEALHARAMAGLANMAETPHAASLSKKALAKPPNNLPVYRRQQPPPAVGVHSAPASAGAAIPCSFLGNCKCPKCA